MYVGVVVMEMVFWGVVVGVNKYVCVGMYVSGIHR